MKKYIAFIVADVVLSEVMWYITCSPTTQEKEVTPEERQIALDILARSVQLANKYGPLILDDSDNFGKVAVTSSAIIYVQYCSRLGMSLHDTVSYLMTVHKQTMALEMQDETDQ